MRIPAPKPPIDKDELIAALDAGESGAWFARRNGFSRGAVYEVIRRNRLKIRRPPKRIRDEVDAALKNIWHSVRGRCENPTSPQYRNFGALGVRVCSAWQQFEAFRDWARETGYSRGKRLTCRSQRLGYRPSNCSWVSASEAIVRGMQFTGRGTFLVAAFGETKSATVWGRDPRAKVCAETIRSRIRVLCSGP